MPITELCQGYATHSDPHPSVHRLSVAEIKMELTNDIETRLIYYVVVGAHEVGADYTNLWKNVDARIKTFKNESIPSADWSILEHHSPKDGATHHSATFDDCKHIVEPLIEHITKAEQDLHANFHRLLILNPTEHLGRAHFHYGNEMEHKAKERFQAKWNSLNELYQGHLNRDMEFSVPVAGIRSFDEFYNVLQHLFQHLLADDVLWFEKTHTGFLNNFMIELRSLLTKNHVS